MSISGITPVQFQFPQISSIGQTPTVGNPEATSGSNFADKLTQAVDAVSAEGARADDALAMLASGEHVDLHGTMIALEEAEIALRTMVSVRDKVINAYETIMNMSI